MQKSLLESIGPRLKQLGQGGYSRVYLERGKRYPSSLHLLVAEILNSLGVKHRQDEPLFPESKVKADFAFGDTLILIDRELSPEEKRKLRRRRKRCIVITRSGKRSDSLDSGLRIVELENEAKGRLETIFLDDPSFNFDYAHILPQTEKCSVMHGHTSSALVEMIGSPMDGMVIDFNTAKPIIRDAIRELDHKLFINEKYVVSRDPTHLDIKFNTVHGDFYLRVPKKTAVLLDGEATVENLAEELLDRIAPRMPANVKSVGVYVYEGLNKGAHLLAEIHKREAERQRRTR